MAEKVYADVRCGDQFKLARPLFGHPIGARGEVTLVFRNDGPRSRRLVRVRFEGEVGEYLVAFPTGDLDFIEGDMVAAPGEETTERVMATIVIRGSDVEEGVIEFKTDHPLAKAYLRDLLGGLYAVQDSFDMPAAREKAREYLNGALIELDAMDRRHRTA